MLNSWNLPRMLYIFLSFFGSGEKNYFILVLKKRAKIRINDQWWLITGLSQCGRICSVTALSTPTISEVPMDSPAFQLLTPSLPLCLLTVFQVFSLCVYHSSQMLATWKRHFSLLCFSPTPFLLTQLIPIFFNAINLHPVSAFPLNKGSSH